MTANRVLIRRVAQLGSGHTPSRSVPEYWEECQIPWLTLADVWQLRDGTTQVVTDTKEKISELGLANSAAEIHPRGTVALSRTASVGFSCILGHDMATSQDFVTWTCGPRLRPRFLLWCLRGLRDEILAWTQGSTHKTIYMPDLEQLRVPVPELPIQDAVADFLDAETARIDALIGKKRHMIDLLEEELAAQIDRRIAVEGAVDTPLMHLTPPDRQIMYGIVLPGPDVEEGILIVKGGDVRPERLTPDTLCRTTPEIEARFARARLRGGDIVFAIRGGIGDVATVPSAIEGANITQDVARVAPAKGVDVRWLYFALKAGRTQAQVEARVTGATVRGINIWDLKRVRVPVPPLSIQVEIGETLAELERHRDQLRRTLDRQIDLLTEHRQALITAAVIGELEISGAAA